MTKQAEKMFQENIDQSLSITRLGILKLLSKLAYIYRWNQDTTRLYSVLNHSLIMVNLVEKFYASPMIGSTGYKLGNTEHRVLKMLALTHDLSEAVILGDVKTWQKKVYLNSTYGSHVKQFENKLHMELVGIFVDYVDMVKLSKIVKELDTMLLAAEFLVITDESVKSDAIIKKALATANPEKVRFAINCLAVDTVYASDMITRAHKLCGDHLCWLDNALSPAEQKEKETLEVRKAT